MEKIRSQSGVTLIELLAVLTILSLIIGVLYSAFMNGLHYSTKAKDTVLIQQEANYLLTLLRKQHEKDNVYTIEVKKDNGAILILEGSSEINRVDNPDFQYFIFDLNDSDTNSCEEPELYDFCKKINPAEEDFHLKMILKNKKDPHIKFEVQTILSRL